MRWFCPEGAPAYEAASSPSFQLFRPKVARRRSYSASEPVCSVHAQRQDRLSVVRYAYAMPEEPWRRWIASAHGEYNDNRTRQVDAAGMQRHRPHENTSLEAGEITQSLLEINAPQPPNGA